jgi:hypothetical protein
VINLCRFPSRGTRNQLSVSKKQDFVSSSDQSNFDQRDNLLEGATTMEATVDVLIVAALIPDYWPLLAGLAMAVALALV